MQFFSPTGLREKLKNIVICCCKRKKLVNFQLLNPRLTERGGLVNPTPVLAM